MHLYALTHEICKIRFGVCTKNKSKQMLAESILLYGVAKKTCKCIKFTALRYKQPINSLIFTRSSVNIYGNKNNFLTFNSIIIYHFTVLLSLRI